MEVFYLANQEDNIHFAMVKGFRTDRAEHTEQDQKIIETGRRLVKLNQKYDRRCFSLQRHRQWNANQSSWMGWERKRGSD